MRWCNGVHSLISRFRRRIPRARAAWLEMFALLLQQLALVAYACPLESLTPAAHVAMASCEDMEKPDPAAPALCDQHCQRDQVAPQALKAPQVPALAVPSLSFALTETLLPRVSAQFYRDVPVWQSDPPPAQRFCSLQI